MPLLCHKCLYDARSGVALAEEVFGPGGRVRALWLSSVQSVRRREAEENGFVREVARAHKGEDLLHGCSSCNFTFE